MNSGAYDRPSYTPPPPVPVQHVGGDSYSSPTSSSAKPFKTKGMQLGSKGAKKQQDLLDTLGGGSDAAAQQQLLEDERASLLAAQEREAQNAARNAPQPVAAAPAAPQKQENPFGPFDEEE